MIKRIKAILFWVMQKRIEVINNKLKPNQKHNIYDKTKNTIVRFRIKSEMTDAVSEHGNKKPSNHFDGLPEGYLIKNKV